MDIGLDVFFIFSLSVKVPYRWNMSLLKPEESFFFLMWQEMWYTAIVIKFASYAVFAMPFYDTCIYFTV